MLDYSAYFVNDVGHIVGVVSIGCRTDDEALAAGRRLLVGTKFPCMEIWNPTRCVAIVDREEAGDNIRALAGCQKHYEYAP
jgi:hypothetical protein